MSMTLEVDLKVLQKLEEEFGPSLRQKLASAFFQELQIEMTEMKKRTPVDTGALRDSGFVEQPTISGNEVSIKMGFGGAASEYALIVHEDLEAFHKVGQAKFMESVLAESGPHLAKRTLRRAKPGLI